MIQATTLSFLTDLASHNHKEWFDENRARYQTARTDFLEFVDELIEEMLEFDPDLQGITAKQCMFRINRDIRFSKDKSPYKTNFGASISRGGRRSEFAGYYLQVMPGNNFVAGGIYMPPGPVLKRIRAHIDLHASDLREAIAEPEFQKHFGAISGPELKTAPKGYEKDHPDIDLLRKKSFTVFSEVEDGLVTGSEIKAVVLERYRAMKPMLDFLNEALANI